LAGIGVKVVSAGSLKKIIWRGVGCAREFRLLEHLLLLWVLLLLLVLSVILRCMSLGAEHHLLIRPMSKMLIGVEEGRLGGMGNWSGWKVGGVCRIEGRGLG